MKGWFRRVAWTALAVAAGLTTWLFLANREHPPVPTVAAHETPDYRMYDARITSFADDGARRYVLLATSVTHFPVSGRTTLTAVDLHYFPPTGREWELQAERGHLDAQGDRLALAGAVHASEVAVANPVRFVAPSLDVFLDTHRVSSDARVTVWQDAREMTGIGMIADLRAGTLTLLRDVTSRYVH